ncbi:MAG: LysR family transcriptional regulator [Allorhizobium sp.]
MDRDTWTDLATLAAIAEAGSFTRAAAKLGVTPSALSHAMKAMETRLGLRLLNRTTRSVAPTEAGEQLLSSLKPAMLDMDAVLAALESRRDRPSGRLRISMHRSAAFQLVLPMMQRFGADYPDVTVEIIIDDSLVDIVGQRLDAGIRRRPSLEKDMISVKLDDGVGLKMIATPDYLRRNGTPKVPVDLKQHRCINYRYPSATTLHRWEFEKDGETSVLDVSGSIITNDIDVLVHAALSGCGIAAAIEQQAAPYLASGALVSVLDDWAPTLPANYLYYSGGRNITPALRAFIDALRRKGG